MRFFVTAGSHLANSMKQNKHMQYSLVSLDLSGNPLGPDPHGALAFLQEPQTIAQLNLSKCNLSFEFVSVCTTWSRIEILGAPFSIELFPSSEELWVRKEFDQNALL